MIEGFHAKDGLVFQRDQGYGVRVVVIRDGAEVFGTSLSPAVWASALLSVGAREETAASLREEMRRHVGFDLMGDEPPEDKPNETSGAEKTEGLCENLRFRLVNAEAALARIRSSMEKHAPTWAGFETNDGLAASVDTFIEVQVNAAKSEVWYHNAMTAVAAATGIRDELPYPYNNNGVNRIVAEIVRLRKVDAAAQETIRLIDSLVGFAMGTLHPNDLAAAELRKAIKGGV